MSSNDSSSDVIDQNTRMTVEDEGECLWYKTRELMEHEIVDTITDSKTNQPRWTIHQPKRGWYLRLRSPTFPPGASINLTPLSNHRDEHGNTASNTRSAEPKLTFGCQTIVPSSIPVQNVNMVDHSYPPSRNSTSSQTSIPSSSTQKSPPTRRQEVTTEGAQDGQDIGEISTEPSSSNPPSSSKPVSKPRSIPLRPPPPKWQVTHYTLELGIPETGPLSGIHHHPHLAHPPTHAPQSSLLSRALAPLKNVGHADSHHFTIQPVSIPGITTNAIASGDLEANSSNAPPNEANAHTETAALVAFTDSTPVLRATPSGTLSVDVDAVRGLGVEMAFWVAVSLAYFDFLRDREGYLAASEEW